MISPLETVIVLLALAGFLNASYFSAVIYGWMRPDPRWMPAVCRLDEASCAAVVFTPQARLLGVPNSLLGQLYYVAVVAGVASGVLVTSPWSGIAVVAAGATIVMGIYLAWSLLFVIRVPCPLCFAGHAINVLLFAALLAL